MGIMGCIPTVRPPTKPSSRPSAAGLLQWPQGPGTSQEVPTPCSICLPVCVLDMKLDPGGLGWRKSVLADSFLSQARGFVMELVAVSQALLSSSTQLRPTEDDVILGG